MSSAIHKHPKDMEREGRLYSYMGAHTPCFPYVLLKMDVNVNTTASGVWKGGQNLNMESREPEGSMQEEEAAGRRII